NERCELCELSELVRRSVQPSVLLLRCPLDAARQASRARLGLRCDCRASTTTRIASDLAFRALTATRNVPPGWLNGKKRGDGGGRSRCDKVMTFWRAQKGSW